MVSPAKPPAGCGAGALRFALPKIAMAPRAKKTASTGKAYRSKTWTRLCPKKATPISSTTTISRVSLSDQPVRVARASAPLTLFTANQPMPAITAFRPAGSRLPRKPKPLRLRTIWGSPARGPQEERMPWVRPPRMLPSTSAATACQKDSLNCTTASTPTKTVANSRLGEAQVHSSWTGEPCRSECGTRSTPPGSTAATRSP